jgi:hypothetical protein
MTIKQPFSPSYGSNLVLTAAAASASAVLPNKTNQLSITNSGASIGHVRVFNSATAKPATTADLPILAGATRIITKDSQQDSIAYISAVGTTLHVMEGEGF